jgi:hypothetical protein
VGIGEDRNRAEPRDTAGGGEEGERRTDHFVAWLEIERHQRDQNRVGARRHRDRVLRAEEGGALAFKRVDFAPEDEVAGAQHPFEGVGELSVERGVLAVEVEERDGHGEKRGRRCRSFEPLMGTDCH